ncbi:unnamed protein product [Zymoseptoria tritici ST99CH_1E4]|uniref:EKC/KEOPS complex subunit CGI121 n=1 Tax=Zymoseptoria tritici ST99CH_1E4 TaxID=1276532 RepID=A0A2H1FJ05_ZYMTR|nr:unnamed protein product [Zymoseptoria tritici ST99CH_1E4]
MEQLLLPHLPDSHTLHIALYTNLQNAEFLHTQLLQGNTSFGYAFLDASVIISRTHLLSAAWRAINDQRAGRLKTRNVHSEIVFALSGNNNIAESFRRHGLTPATTSLLAIKVAPSDQHSSISTHLSENIQGDLLHFTDEKLAGLRDDARIKKIYRIPQAVGKDASGRESWRKEVEGGIVGSMVLKGS